MISDELRWSSAPSYHYIITTVISFFITRHLNSSNKALINRNTSDNRIYEREKKIKRNKDKWINELRCDKIIHIPISSAAAVLCRWHVNLFAKCVGKRDNCQNKFSSNAGPAHETAITSLWGNASGSDTAGRNGRGRWCYAGGWGGGGKVMLAWRRRRGVQSSRAWLGKARRKMQKL